MILTILGNLGQRASVDHDRSPYDNDSGQDANHLWYLNYRTVFPNDHCFKVVELFEFRRPDRIQVRIYIIKRRIYLRCPASH